MHKAEIDLRKKIREQRKEEAAAEREEESMLDTLEMRIEAEKSLDIDTTQACAGRGSI